ncbi:MAG: hypothetical protein EBT13_06875 [Rhodobacteraceae bacterium]|nr:hypothetical protein [Paracoccaceae bacterium]
MDFIFGSLLWGFGALTLKLQRGGVKRVFDKVTGTLNAVKMGLHRGGAQASGVFLPSEDARLFRARGALVASGYGDDLGLGKLHGGGLWWFGWVS